MVPHELTELLGRAAVVYHGCALHQGTRNLDGGGSRRAALGTAGHQLRLILGVECASVEQKTQLPSRQMTSRVDHAETD